MDTAVMKICSMLLPVCLSLFESGLQHQQNSFIWSYSGFLPSSFQCKILTLSTRHYWEWK